MSELGSLEANHDESGGGGMTACTCDWPDHCDGSGILRCYSYDFDCYCYCGHEEECYGCENCEDRDRLEDGDDYEEELDR